MRLLTDAALTRGVLILMMARTDIVSAVRVATLVRDHRDQLVAPARVQRALGGRLCAACAKAVQQWDVRKIRWNETFKN